MPSDQSRRTISRLRELLTEETEEWRIEREPHKYGDGTDHFTHVVYTAEDCEGAPMKVAVGMYLTESLAELLVTAKKELPELLRLAEIGIEAERAGR